MSEVFIAGEPAPQGSKQAYVRGGRAVLVEASKKLMPWRKHVATVFGEFWDRGPIEGGVRADIEFVMPRPKSLPKTKPTPPAIKRPDVDKLVRAIFDAITGRAFLDDSQVVDMRVLKRVAELDEPSGVFIEVKESGAIPRRARPVHV
ncbi:RusA-like Holliday junction resolvase [Gordonia phage Neville]|uniref:RusA-like resolvase n=2 Tax=Nevillevirus TaxID=3044773 RepID=A0A515MH23_9CAUD|nr:RusA-like Holliday junction resolvase [Gordonia phage Neville]YP_010246064.1 RusA-like Holliday junction resolvase [Gordonia phage Trax]AXQ64445.1 RusA-like resolvase [Gordonia phage Neville]QDM55966.1 RusA-like resolvase [Gordonia phage Trax]